MKRGRNDLILIALLLALAAGLWLWTGRPGERGGWVVVTVDGTETARYPLWEDRQVTIGEGDYNVLTISEGTAAVTEANCGDHTCVRTGTVSRAGESIICLPHRLVIEIAGGAAGAPDAVTG